MEKSQYGKQGCGEPFDKTQGSLANRIDPIAVSWSNPFAVSLSNGLKRCESSVTASYGIPLGQCKKLGH